MAKKIIRNLWYDYAHSFEPNVIVDTCCKPSAVISPVAVVVIFILLAHYQEHAKEIIGLQHFYVPLLLIGTAGSLSLCSWKFGRNSATLLAGLQMVETILYSGAFVSLAALSHPPASYVLAGITALVYLYYSTVFAYSLMGVLLIMIAPITVLAADLLDAISTFVMASGIIFYIASSKNTAIQRKNLRQMDRTEDVLNRLQTLRERTVNASGHQLNEVGLIHSLKNELLPFHMDLSHAGTLIKNPEASIIISKATTELDQMIRGLEKTLKEANVTQPDTQIYPFDEIADELEDLFTLQPCLDIFEVDRLPVIMMAGDIASTVTAFENLINNAIEAGASQVRLHASVLDNGASVEILLSDNGPGLPGDVEKRLFSPYNTEGKSRGVGLGIYLAGQLIDANNGKILLDASSAQGTTFRILLTTAVRSSQSLAYNGLEMDDI